MSWQYTPYVLPPLLASALMVVLWAYASQHRYTVGAVSFRALVLFVSVWTLASALQIGSVSLADQFFWVKVGYLGVAGVPVCTLAFVMQYFTWENRPTRREWGLLAIVPVITLILLWTDIGHGLMVRSVTPDTASAYPAIHIIYGPWLWVHLGYSNLLLLAAAALVVRAMLTTHAAHRAQGILFLSALLLPWAANVLFVIERRAIMGLDLTPFAFSLSGLTLAWGLQRYGFLDLAPLAREMVVERMADALVVLDLWGRILDMNAAALRLWSRPLASCLGRPFSSLLTVGPALEWGIAELQPAREEITMGPDSSPHTYEVRLMPLRDAHDRPVGSTVVVSDITVRRHAEIQIRENLALFTTLIDSLRMAVMAEGPDGRVVHVNRLMASMFGLKDLPEALVGRAVSSLVQQIRAQVADPVRMDRVVLEPAARGESVLNAEIAMRDGRICECDCVPIRDGASVSDGDGRHARLWICRDVTQRVQFETRLRHTHKMEAIGQLAGGIAHEFNNLLTVINGYAQYMETRLDPDDPLYADAETIVRAGMRAAELTGQMLAFSRRQNLNIRVIDLNAVLEGLGRMLCRVIGEQVTVELDLAPDLDLVEADSGYIEQVVMNLATNARDAMPTGGTLTISTGNMDLGQPLSLGTAVVPAGRYAMLKVADTGHGMTEEVRRHLFEPFFTTKAPGKGTGLGLAMIHGIVEQLGGQIAVDSAVGMGTTITIYLPRAHDGTDGLPGYGRLAAAADAVPAPIAVSRGNETILLVEDQDDVRQALQDMLMRLGYGVVAASGGLDALEHLRQDAAAADMVLTDVVMPGMSGRELGDILGRTHPQLPVLYMSGHPDDVLGDYGALSLGERLISKPISVADLAVRLRRALEPPA